MTVQAQAAAYPIQLVLPKEREVNRWWGLLWFGMLVRMILAIPHFVILMVLAICFGLGMIVVWIPILIFGRAPSWWCSLVGEFLQRSTRVGAYVLLFPGGYPPLGFGEPGPVDLSIETGDRSLNRLWGIPYFGFMVRYIVLIPQLIVMFVLAIAVYIVILVFWIPILINGRYPNLAMRIIGVYLQYNARVSGYMLFLPVPYPPFDFG
jgi:hypothetical protein